MDARSARRPAFRNFKRKSWAYAADATIADEATGVIHHHYRAINVVSLVAAVDEDASTFVRLGDATLMRHYEAIALDERKCGGALMFRLAEKPSALVVHESIRSALRHRGFDRLEFIAPAEWAG